jgi:hypothetical protein
MNKDKFIETKTVAQKIKEDMIRGIINPSPHCGDRRDDPVVIAVKQLCDLLDEFIRESDTE